MASQHLPALPRAAHRYPRLGSFGAARDEKSQLRQFSDSKGLSDAPRRVATIAGVFTGGDELGGAFSLIYPIVCNADNAQSPLNSGMYNSQFSE